jgi:hypothetical protein
VGRPRKREFAGSVAGTPYSLHHKYAAEVRKKKGRAELTFTVMFSVSVDGVAPPMHFMLVVKPGQCAIRIALAQIRAVLSPSEFEARGGAAAAARFEELDAAGEVSAEPAPRDDEMVVARTCTRSMSAMSKSPSPREATLAEACARVPMAIASASDREYVRFVLKRKYAALVDRRLCEVRRCANRNAQRAFERWLAHKLKSIVLHAGYTDDRREFLVTDVKRHENGWLEEMDDGTVFREPGPCFEFCYSAPPYAGWRSEQAVEAERRSRPAKKKRLEKRLTNPRAE